MIFFFLLSSDEFDMDNFTLFFKNLNNQLYVIFLSGEMLPVLAGREVSKV